MKQFLSNDDRNYGEGTGAPEKPPVKVVKKEAKKKPKPKKG